VIIIKEKKITPACDDDARSETLLHVFKTGEPVAELDVASERMSVSGQDDLQFLRQVAALVAPPLCPTTAV